MSTRNGPLVRLVFTAAHMMIGGIGYADPSKLGYHMHMTRIVVAFGS